MSNEERIPAMEALKELSEEDKRFVLGYAAGVVAAKQQPEKETESKGEEAQA